MFAFGRGSSFAFGGLTGAVALAAFSVVVPPQVNAQTPLHFAAGPTLANMSTDEPGFQDAEAKIGFFAAVGTSLMLGDNVFLSPYLGYVQKGAEFDDGAFEASYDYIEIPVLLGTGFPIGESVTGSVFAGPQVGFQINCDEEGFDCTEFDDHKGTEFGVMFGGGLKFPAGGSGALSVGVGADFGLTDLFESADDGFKTRTFFLSLGYSTALGGGGDANGM